jgi:WD40 repeat protein
MQFWDLTTSKELLDRLAHDASVDSMALSPDGKQLAAGHQDSAILVWDISAAHERRVCSTRQQWTIDAARMHGMELNRDAFDAVTAGLIDSPTL